MYYTSCFYFSDEIVDANVFIFYTHLPFIFFAVNVKYKTGEANYSLPTYWWSFTAIGCLEYGNLTFNSTSPLLNYSFGCAGNYYYDLWVYNAVSSVHKEGRLHLFVICYLKIDIIVYI